jgi:hypothetical protein
MLHLLTADFDVMDGARSQQRAALGWRSTSRPLKLLASSSPHRYSRAPMR